MNTTYNYFDNKFSINIPEEFVPSDEKQKYFGSSEPNYLYIFEDKEAVISITKTDMDFTADSIETRLNEYIGAYSRAIPHFDNCKLAKRVLSNGVEIGAFHYTSTSVKRDNLNFFVLGVIDGKEIVVTMHCDAQDGISLGQKFMSVINSISINND